MVLYEFSADKLPIIFILPNDIRPFRRCNQRSGFVHNPGIDQIAWVKAFPVPAQAVSVLEGRSGLEERRSELVSVLIRGKIPVQNLIFLLVSKSNRLGFGSFWDLSRLLNFLEVVLFGGLLQGCVLERLEIFVSLLLILLLRSLLLLIGSFTFIILLLGQPILLLILELHLFEIFLHFCYLALLVFGFQLLNLCSLFYNGFSELLILLSYIRLGFILIKQTLKLIEVHLVVVHFV